MDDVAQKNDLGTDAPGPTVGPGATDRASRPDTPIYPGGTDDPAGMAPEQSPDSTGGPQPPLAGNGQPQVIKDYGNSSEADQERQPK